MPITYDELLSSVSVKSDVVASLCNSIPSIVFKPVSWFLAWEVIRKSRSILNDITLLEREYCSRCDEKCTIELKDDMESLLDSMSRVLEEEKKMNFPNFLITRQEYIFDEFEDKLENYWIASDPKIKELATSVYSKM